MFFGSLEYDMKEYQYSILLYDKTEDIAFFRQENEKKMASLSHSLKKATRDNLHFKKESCSSSRTGGVYRHMKIKKP